jgi:hypothetical protein
MELIEVRWKLVAALCALVAALAVQAYNNATDHPPVEERIPTTVYVPKEAG